MIVPNYDAALCARLPMYAARRSRRAPLPSYLTKPLDVAELLVLLDEILAAREEG